MLQFGAITVKVTYVAVYNSQVMSLSCVVAHYVVVEELGRTSVLLRSLARQALSFVRVLCWGGKFMGSMVTLSFLSMKLCSTRFLRIFLAVVLAVLSVAFLLTGVSSDARSATMKVMSLSSRAEILSSMYFSRFLVIVLTVSRSTGILSSVFLDVVALRASGVGVG